MKKKFLSFLFLLCNFSVFAQSILDETEKQTHFELGMEAATHNYFAAVKFALQGATFSPYVMYFHKSGFYVSVQPNFFSDKKVLKKTYLPELDNTFGYKYLSENVYFDISYIHTKVNYGNALFKKFLNNALIADANFSITDNLQINPNITFLMGKGKKTQFVPFYSLGVLYNFEFDNVLSAKDFTIAPCIAAYAGSTKVYDAMALRDSLTLNTLKESNKTIMQAYQPSIQTTWRSNKVELDLNLNFPYAKTHYFSNATPPTDDYRFGKVTFYANFMFRYFISTHKK